MSDLQSASPPTAKSTRKNSRVKIRNDPEVPTSNTSPTIEPIIFFEKNEETRAIIGNKARGISILVFGIDITPRESIFAKKSAVRATTKVASILIFAEYRGKVVLGIKKIGNINTKATKTYLKIFPKLKLFACCACSSMVFDFYLTPPKFFGFPLSLSRRGARGEVIYNL